MSGLIARPARSASGDPGGTRAGVRGRTIGRGWVALAATALAWACGPGPPDSGVALAPQAGRSVHDARRARMVAEQLRARDIDDPRVLAAMGHVPRHLFVEPGLWPFAYDDRPLPIPLGQTISQPYIVALMTQLARPDPGDRALDVGTGSGYQAAVLAELVGSVHSIEIHGELAESARGRLERLGYRNIEVRHGDGYRGWPERAPFDVIVVAAAPREVPPALVAQLAPGGRLVLPVGDRGTQDLILIERRPDGSIARRIITPVAFVPMTGAARERGGQP